MSLSFIFLQESSFLHGHECCMHSFYLMIFIPSFAISQTRNLAVKTITTIAWEFSAFNRNRDGTYSYFHMIQYWHFFDKVIHFYTYLIDLLHLICIQLFSGSEIFFSDDEHVKVLNDWISEMETWTIYY